MIAMDMDGTLLTSENKILPETRKALLDVQKQGIRLVLASGRSYNKLMPYAKELHMDQYGGYLVEINGAAVYDLKHEQRSVKKRMKAEHIQELFTYFKQWKVEILAHVDDGLYDYNPPEILAEKKAYIKEQGLPLDHPLTGGPFSFVHDNRNGYPRNMYVEEASEVTEDINKISVTYHADIINEISEQAKRDLSDHYWIGKTSPKWLEVMLPGITKATGLLDVAKKCGIHMEEVMAFGDGENDLEMLDEVGVGIAMDNAMDIVKEHAKEVCASNECNGIAEVLHKHFNL